MKKDKQTYGVEKQGYNIYGADSRPKKKDIFHFVEKKTDSRVLY